VSWPATCFTSEIEPTIRRDILPPSSSSPKDGGSMFLRNVDIYLQVHTASQRRRRGEVCEPKELRFAI
jgi:hypothetical protein